MGVTHDSLELSIGLLGSTLCVISADIVIGYWDDLKKDALVNTEHVTLR